MKRFLVVLSLFLIGLLHHTGAFPPVQSGAVRTQRDAFCRRSVEYPHAGICCSYCSAGTYVKAHCTRNGQGGQCEECEDGTFTEHDNDLTRCLSCTQCRSDQRLVKPCTHSADATCQCQPGRFCHPDEACEVCRKCRSCKKDEEELVRNCTPTSDTECKKPAAPPGPASDSTMLIVLVSLATVVVVVVWVGVMFFFYQRIRRPSGSLPGSNRDQPHPTKHDLLYTAAPVIDGEGEPRRASSLSMMGRAHLVRVRSSLGGVEEEERKRLCDSLSSLTGPMAPAAPPVHPPHASLILSTQHTRREEEFPMLVPLKGEESLRSCFTYFEDLNVNHYKRFFRTLGINDNKIHDADRLHYTDQMHELLNVWVEKEGREASLNHLLQALLDLDHKFTAETIKQQAILQGHYKVAE